MQIIRTILIATIFISITPIYSGEFCRTGGDLVSRGESCFQISTGTTWWTPPVETWMTFEEADALCKSKNMKLPSMVQVRQFMQELGRLGQPAPADLLFWIKDQEQTTDGAFRRMVVDFSTLRPMAVDNGTYSVICKDQSITLSAGRNHSCALIEGGLQCWGATGTIEDYGQAQVPVGLAGITSVSAGNRHTCAVSGGKVDCWGTKHDGMTDVPWIFENPRMLSASGYRTCVVDDSGLSCWGGLPLKLQLGVDVTYMQMVATGDFQTCIIDNNRVRCFSFDGQEMADVPTNLINPRAITAGNRHACALDDVGVKCWGSNAFSETRVPQDLRNPRMVTAGTNHTCALDDTGVRCWGYNGDGQTEVPADLKNPRMVSAGGFHTCALDDSGIRCWGSNEYSQLNVPRALQKSKK